MKKTFIYGILLSISVACSKNYTCNCTVETFQQAYTAGDPDGDASTTTTNSSNEIKGSKKNATETCEDPNGEVIQDARVDGDGIYQKIKTTCSIK